MRVVLLFVVVVVSACATGGAKHDSAASSCPLRESDAPFMTGGVVYRDCAVTHKARLVSEARPDFQPSRGTACYAVDFDFVVDRTGKPEIQTARITRSNDQAFAQAVLATLARWKYEPAVRDGEPVRQIVTEHRAAQTMVLVVPAGSSPAAARPPAGRTPNC
jgi:hypothetical protein